MKTTRLARLALLGATLAAAPRGLASGNHLMNSGFDSDLSVWTVPAGNGYSSNWTDARGSKAPGAFSIYAFGSAILVSSPLNQCVGVVGGAPYDISLDFRYEAGFGTAEYAYFVLQFYEDGFCAGTPLSTFAPAPTTSTDAALASVWQHLSVPVSAPAAASSLRLSVAVRTHVASNAQGYIDDVKVSGGTSGDANGDGIVDVADVFYLIGHLFSSGPLPRGPSDVNDSDSIDVSDVFYVINYLFAKGPAPL